MSKVESTASTAIPQILALLDVKGAVVTVDALGCQKAIAARISQAGADYVLALKDNHHQLREDVGQWLEADASKGTLAVHETVDKGHGRIDICRYVLDERLDWLEPEAQWPGLRAVGRVESTRLIGERSSTECRYYLTSLTNLERFAEAVRGHWGIENSQHWVLAVQFGEDAHPAQGPFAHQSGLGTAHRVECHPPQRPFQTQPAHPKTPGLPHDDYRFMLIFGKTT